MAVLGVLIQALMGILFNIFGRFMVAEKAFNLAMMLIVLAMAAAIIAAMNSCATGVCGQAISHMSDSHRNFAVGLGIVFNSTTYSAVSAYMLVWVGCQMYVVKKRAILMLK